jgi:hypothetical protein
LEAYGQRVVTSNCPSVAAAMDTAAAYRVMDTAAVYRRESTMVSSQAMLSSQARLSSVRYPVFNRSRPSSVHARRCNRSAL